MPSTSTKDKSKQQNNKQKRVLCLLRRPQNIPHLSPHRLIKGIRDSSRWFQEFPWTSSFSLILVFHRLYLLGLRSSLQAQFCLWIFGPGICIWSPHRFTLRFLQHLWSLQCSLTPPCSRLLWMFCISKNNFLIFPVL